MSVKQSRLLGQILRHDPYSYGLSISNEGGWVSVADIILKVECLNSLEILQTIVNEKPKKRYDFNEDKTLVRALQGHSIKDIKMYFKSIKLDQDLYHGTHPNLVNVILKEGLKPMNRQFVHLSKNEDIAYEVGKRYSKKLEPAILLIDKNADLSFYLSDNGVYLTKHVDPKYISILKS
jgi:putative RNA 2'-phosphotransferase